MWTPYGLVPYGEVSQEQMAVSVGMMNPMMNPMMMNPMMSQMMRSSGYGPVQFPPQMPGQLQHHSYTVGRCLIQQSDLPNPQL